MWLRTTDLVQSSTVQMTGDLKEILIQYVVTACHIVSIRLNDRAAKVVAAGGHVGRGVEGSGEEEQHTIRLKTQVEDVLTTVPKELIRLS